MNYHGIDDSMASKHTDGFEIFQASLVQMYQFCLRFLDNRKQRFSPVQGRFAGAPPSSQAATESFSGCPTRIRSVCGRNLDKVS